jgi:hypothetical protein
MATNEEELHQWYELGMLDKEHYEEELAKLKAAGGSGAEEPAPASAPVPASAESSAASAPPPMPPPLDAEEWYTAVNGAQQGPYNKAKIAAMLKTGEIKRDTQVWKKGMAGWIVISNVPELQDIIAELPPPVEAPPVAEAVPEMLTTPIRETVNEYGNTPGNIINGGYAAIQGDWIYYNNASDDGKLYKIKTDGSGRQKLNDDVSSYINVIGDWIYYTDDIGNICKIKTDGSERQLVE